MGTRPAWFNPGTYNWSPEMGHDIADWSPEAQSNVQQQWWRDPKWGGHIIWNPQYGFQNLGSVQDFYKGWDPSATPNFSRAFREAGFSKQLSDAGNWREFYPDRPVVQNQPKNPWGQNPYGQTQWGQPPAPTPSYGDDTKAETTGESTGFYAPKYGSTVSQHMPRQASGQGYGRGAQYKSPSQGRYYGESKKRNTSMRYGYRPSM